MNIRSHSESDTRRTAADWMAGQHRPGLIRLHGDLGAGKTCFVRGLLEALGWEGPVTSPTYALMQEYPTSPPLIHLDLYRLTDPEEIWDLGIEDWMEQEAWIAVEWSERAENFWPRSAWEVRLTAEPDDPAARRIDICPPEDV